MLKALLTLALTTTAFASSAIAEEVKGHKVAITTNVQMNGFSDDGTYSAGVITTANPCPGVSVYDGKDAGRVKARMRLKRGSKIICRLSMTALIIL
jgi:hypothetical protein